jgi:hypothetical protein
LNSFKQDKRQIVPRARHMLVLGGLLAFVAYFGVWRGYRITEQVFGPIWAAVFAIAAGLGLFVIAAVGVIIIRTMRIMENSAAEKPNDDAQPPAPGQ